MKPILALVCVCGLALPLSSALAQQGQQPPAKIVVKSQDDLPRHMYKIEGKASDFLVSDKAFAQFAAKVKADVEGDLAKYDIQDNTTRQQYLSILQQIAVIENRWDDALKLVEQIRELEGKESKKLLTGQVLGAYVAAAKASPNDDAARDAAFKQDLSLRIKSLPWSVVREDVLQARARAQIITRDLMMGSMKAQLDPVIEQQKGEISNELAWPLISARATLDVMLPLQPAVAEVYSKVIEQAQAKAAPARDIWTPSQVTLTEKDKGTPVVVAIWDSGVDVNCFPGKLWVNPKETANGKDDDGNGFVDDVNGIAFNLTGDRVPELVHPITELKSDIKTVTKYAKGITDLQAGVESPEAEAARIYMSKLKADEVLAFQEDSGLFGNYSHGTHVAGIAAEGNPFVRLLPIRISFDFRVIPTLTPSVEQARKDAQAGLDTVAYMKKAGVRVVNMSWGGSRKDIEQALEIKGVGANAQERAELSRELFGIWRDALETAIKSAPEILFIAAAGNSDNDNEFAELLPSGLKEPNLITVGAIDKSGKPTSFTTFGKNVTLYANGFEVNSNIPGCEKMNFSGTSMAAPNVANLAGKLLALNPSLSTSEVIELLKAGAEPMEGHEGRLIINPSKSIGLIRK